MHSRDSGDRGGVTMVQNVRCEILEDIQEEAAAGMAGLVAREGIWTGENN